MSDRFWVQLAASCGALAVALLAAGNEVQKIGGSSPGLHDSPQQYAEAVGAPTAVLLGGFLVILGLLLFIPFFAALSQVLSPLSGEQHMLSNMLLGGGLLTVAMGLAGAAPLVAAGTLADDGQLEPGLAKALSLMNGGSFVLMWATSATWVAVTSALVLRTRSLPRFIGWTGALLAPALLAGSLLVFKYEAATAAWLLALIWIIATSIAAVVHAGQPHPRPSQVSVSAPNQA